MGNQTEIILDGLSAPQRSAAQEIDRDVLVRAGAGSGKTKTLVARYLLLLDEHRDWHPADITAVTFTRKAAREMQSRIRERMMDIILGTVPSWDSPRDCHRSGDSPVKGQSPDKYAGLWGKSHEGTVPEDRQFWQQMLNEMDSANIGTIHSLCGRILRAHPAEAGLDPAFTVLDDNRAAMLRGQIVEETISKISVLPDYDALLNFYSSNKLSDILNDMLANRGKTDLALSVPSISTEEFLRKQVEVFLYDSDYAKFIDEYREISSQSDFEKKFKAFGTHLLELISGYDEACAAFKDGNHPAEAINLFHAPFKGWTLKERADGYHTGALKIRDDLRAMFPFLVKDSTHPNRDIPWYQDFWKQCDEADECLRKLWPEVRGNYMKLLDAAQEIDFDAMEMLTLELLRNHPEIREAWTERVKALLVDEFQDTNETQAELFTLLNPSRNRLFAVGDKKQSIYGFRGTNVALFDRRGEEVKHSDGLDIVLDTTYRTEPELLLPMGKMLERVMSDRELAGKEYFASYEPMKNPVSPIVKKFSLPKVQPSIELLLRNIQGKEEDPDNEIVGTMLAQRLKELQGAGLIRNWNDTVILCRNSNDFKQFERALSGENIPYVTVAGKGYYDRPEIRDILNILQSAENPNDNASLTGFLLSPSIGFTLEMTVLLYRYANKGETKMSFYQAMKDEAFGFDAEEKQKKLARAREVLEQLIHISGQVPLDEVLAEAYRLTGVRTMLALDEGDRAWLNLDKLIPVARESKMTSVSEFLDYLKNIEETGAREGEAPSDNNGAVRIMTIHQAKGLEFPVTILYDNEFRIPKQPNFIENPNGSYAFYSSPSHPRLEEAKRLAESKDKAEWLRLFYVAATRAEYRLILCGDKPVWDGKKDSWLKRIVASLPPEWDETDEYVGPAWGIDGQTVRVRTCAVKPDISNEDVKSSESKIMIEGDDSLLQPLGKLEEQIARSPEHTEALTVGKLVYKGLELWRFPDGNESDSVLREAFAKILMRTENLNTEEQKAVLKNAECLLQRFGESEVRKQIETAEQRWHEIPFSYTGRKFTVNGIIDLLLKDEEGYTVIDFKTDELKSLRDLTDAREEHAKQLKKYRRALQITLGEEPRCMICFLDYCGQVLLEPMSSPVEDAPDTDEEDNYLYESESDNFLFEEDYKYSDLFPSIID